MMDRKISHEARAKLEREAAERGVPVQELIDAHLHGETPGIEPDDGVALSE